MAKIKISLKRFLFKLDRLSEYKIRSVMGKEYIDTPGNYIQERRDYSSIFDYCRSNMASDFEKLKRWYQRNPKKVEKIMKLK